MEVFRKYTDENYIAINDLQSFGENFVIQTQEYRQSFIQIIPINELDFVKIVETPALVKKRYSKNVDLKGHVDINSEENDFILEIAKKLVVGDEIQGIDLHTRESIIKKYEDNNKDLTIVTNYLTNNSDKLKLQSESKDISGIYPELTKKDMAFLNKCNDPSINYTIKNFQKITTSSYETGRKSLEKLTELELFKKNKAGKKFVYKPTNKLNKYMKGGN